MKLYILYDEYKKKSVGMSLFKEPQVNGESSASCSQAREHELMEKTGNKRHEIGRGLNWDEDEFAVSYFFL